LNDDRGESRFDNRLGNCTRGDYRCGSIDIPSCSKCRFSRYVYRRGIDRATRKPIVNADILIAQDQTLPEVLHSDSNGAFAVRLHPGSVSIRINVTASGYVPEVRVVSPSRTGPEEFQLQPNSSGPVSHKPAPNTSRPVQPSVPSQAGTCEGSQGPCIGVNNGTANFYTLGAPPPPIRNVRPEYVTDAISTLRIAPQGTRLRIDGVGTSEDLENFVSEIQELFRLGGWDAFKGSRSVNSIETVINDSGVSTSHGEGIRCFATNASVAFIARRALEKIGYPCQVDYTPQYLDRIPADFYVSVGAPK
jgi:hypothetical protein